ncbi:hypothetical protein ACIOKD_32395 [Streptomyces sp. NPDC087844]|uniref:hypothetical protein n=1 Tax=Streptomyces sp. NPDC087844 TaxID=3365805 RepID=UPI003830E670
MAAERLFEPPGPVVPGHFRVDEQTLLGDPALDDVPATTVDKGAADLFRYTLRFDGRTVVTDRSAERPPLDRLIDALGTWLPT